MLNSRAASVDNRVVYQDNPAEVIARISAREWGNRASCEVDLSVLTRNGLYDNELAPFINLFLVKDGVSAWQVISDAEQAFERRINTLLANMKKTFAELRQKLGEG